MEPQKSNLVDTILNTPKPTASSTVDRKVLKKTKFHKLGNDDSLGILSLSNMSLSSVIEEESQNRLSTAQDSISCHLEKQRSLAETSLRRASNKVSGLPSKYFKPNQMTPGQNYTMNASIESTINESDLLKEPTDTSTPRSSGRLSLSESVQALSYKLSSNNISMDNFWQEFKKTMNIDEVPQMDSLSFKPAEEAASMLLADEMAWRQENEMPITDDAFSEVSSVGKVSVGEFFRQRSDSLSNIVGAKSPTKSKPVPLIDTSTTFSEDKTEVTVEIPQNIKTLSLSTIQRCLESDYTPKRALDLLLAQAGNPEKCDRFDKSSDDNLSVPVGNNSSYTSDHSENEAINMIVNKENINSLNTTKMSVLKSESLSSRSSSRALTSLPEGKLPIESTANELIWGCIKIDKCVTQDFSIRNKSSKRLGLQMSVSGYNFKIRKDNRADSELLSSAKLILGPHESKVIIVSFIPSKIGASVDELCFTPIDSNMLQTQTKKQSVRLFGYGGHDKIDLHNLTKDTSGKYWMSLGKLGIQDEMHQTFTLKNNGILPSFVHINFASKGLFQVTVQPSFFVLIPQEQKEVTVSNILTSDSYKLLNKYLNSSTIAELGTLQIVSGAEVNRGRLRRLCRKISEAGSVVDPLSNSLKERIKGEIMPNDLIKFRESTSAFRQILECFSRHEIILTVERDLDQTILAQYPDETGMYQTLCEDNATSVLDNTVCLHSCRLEPPIIFLTPPTKVTDFLFLISETNRVLHFEICCEPEGLDIKPLEDILEPKQELTISLTYSKTLASPVSSYKVRIYIDNDILEATVKIK